MTLRDAGTTLSAIQACLSGATEGQPILDDELGLGRLTDGRAPEHLDGWKRVGGRSLPPCDRSNALAGGFSNPAQERSS